MDKEEDEDKEEVDKIIKTSTMKREVNLQEVVAEEIIQGKMGDNMTSPKLNATIVKSMTTMLWSVRILLAMLKRM